MGSGRRSSRGHLLPRGSRLWRLAIASAAGLAILGAAAFRALAFTTFGNTAKHTAAGAPVRGGTLTVGRSNDVFGFDPPATPDCTSIFTELQIYDRLVKLAPDGKHVVPELAT